MKDQVVSVFGGSGFLGSYIVRDLLASGAHVKIFSKNPESALHLKIDAKLGQLESHYIDIRNQDAIKNAIEGSDAVINLIGTTLGSAKKLFITHVLFPKFLARAAKHSGIHRLIHFSTIGVDRIYDSNYAHSKYEGDQCVHQEHRHAIVIRPSVVFGQKDHFINKLYFTLTRFLIFPISNQKNHVNPIYAGDISKSVVQLLNNYDRYQGRVLDFVGTTSYSMHDIISLIESSIGKNIRSISLPRYLHRAYVLLSRLFPNPIMNKEQTHLLRHSHRTSKNYLKRMEISATDLEKFISSYLKEH